MIDVDDPHITRARAAQDITEKLFPVTERNLRTWTDVPIVLISGRACAPRSIWLEAAEKRRRAANFGNPDNVRGAAANARAARKPVLAR